MEYIFLESLVLQTMNCAPLTAEYIRDNYTTIIPDYQILDDLKQEFTNLYQKNIDQISTLKLDSLLSILHKYNIKTHYTELLKYAIWKMLNLEYIPENLCSDIMTDIINHNCDFTNILKHLLKHCIELQPEDYFFSLPLLEKSPYGIPENPEMEMPIKYGLFEVIKHIYQQNENIKKDHIFMIYAVCYGKIEIIKWAHENGFPSGGQLCVYAAEGGHFEILKWAYENGYDISVDTCYCAIRGGNIEILKWLHQNDFDVDFDEEDCCTIAADCGYFEILKWLREIDCPWDGDTIIEIVKRNGNTEILKWLQENMMKCIKLGKSNETKNTDYETNNDSDSDSDSDNDSDNDSVNVYDSN